MTIMRVRPRVLAGAVAALSAGLLVACGAFPVAAAETPPSVAAQSLLADFTFESVPLGGAFSDRGTRATVKGTASLVAGREGQGSAAAISSGFWLNLTATDGQPLLKGRGSVTISYDVKPNLDGNVGWSVFAARSAASQSYGQETYVGVLDRTTGITVERYDNFDSDRNTWFKSVNLRANGALDLSLGKDQEVAPANRTVRATITVTATAAPVTATAASRCVAGKAVVTVATVNAASSTADVRWSTAWGVRSQQVGAQKTASLAISTRTTSIVAGTLTGTATTTSGTTPVTAAYPAVRCA
jgi:hypothetical protein